MVTSPTGVGMGWRFPRQLVVSRTTGLGTSAWAPDVCGWPGVTQNSVTSVELAVSQPFASAAPRQPPSPMRPGGPALGRRPSPAARLDVRRPHHLMLTLGTYGSLEPSTTSWWGESAVAKPRPNLLLPMMAIITSRAASWPGGSHREFGSSPAIGDSPAYVLLLTSRRLPSGSLTCATWRNHSSRSWGCVTLWAPCATSRWYDSSTSSTATHKTARSPRPGAG